ncbi:MAG: DNA repair protein RecN [Clostridia bacterium]|nr:DNA repair protein RecN [Clostridia bacterium]
MLSQLYIENIAVIERAAIDFEAGFNVLTGETGAGKSIIIDAIQAIRGERMSKELIRTGAASAQVSAVFSDLSGSAVEKLASLGYEVESDGTLLIQRTLRPEGKSVCKIGGRPATVSVLKELGERLVAILGQHESYELMTPDLHVRYIDAYGGHGEILHAYEQAYSELRAIMAQLDALTADETQKARRTDLLRYQIEELENAGIRLGEIEELKQRRDVMRNSEKIAAFLYEALSALDGDEDQDGAMQLTENAAASAESAAQILSDVHPAAQQLRDAAYALQDAVETLRGCSETLSFDAEELNVVEDRLDYLYRLGLKYGETEEEMLGFLERSKEELLGIELSDEKIEELEAAFDAAKEKAIALAKELSAMRHSAAADFSQRVKNELAFLNMPNVVFCVEQLRTSLHALGCDKLQFLISTNPGEEPRPMAKIASGGELSRIMLAIKTVLAGNDDIGTFIFDEIDTGISGLSARKVGQKLKEVAGSHQVLCVTHLAQIAAMGDHHFLIEKHVDGERTFTNVNSLDMEARKREIARIVSGGEITPLRLKMAEEMLRGEE